MIYPVLFGVVGLAIVAYLLLLRRKNTPSKPDLGTLQLRLDTLENSYDSTLELLGGMLDMTETNSNRHARRVTAFTIAIARHMGIATEEIRIIARGAFLHDIGMHFVPDAILRKPGPLSSEEIAILQEHCSRGHRMIKPIPYLQEAAEIVYSHHERFDGTGYPRGLKGHEIPLGARIFAIADTLDAITSDRPYRQRQPIARARQEIQRCSGLQFDPGIVRAFLSMPENIWEDLKNEIDRPN
jgi:cyclic di-GMP phosphodiesterase